MFHDIHTALKNEIKNIIFKSWFHFIRFAGLMIIPLIYGFSYIFAFYDPFPKINQLQISVVTDSKDSDPFGYAIGEALKKAPIAIGETKMNLSMDHIYVNGNNLMEVTADGTEKPVGSQRDDVTLKNKIDELKTDSYSTIEMRSDNPTINSITSIMKPFINAALKSGNKLPFAQMINAISQTHHLQIAMSPNFKKNYLIAFGFNIGSAMQGTYIAAIREALGVLNIPNPTATNNGPFGISGADQAKMNKWIQDSKSEVGPGGVGINPVTIHTNFGEDQHNKYGYGLAPFFICVAMWIGGMVMTFAVHRKIYDKSVTPGHRYFAKWILIVSGTIVQATLLMVSLYLIGFKDLGLSHWGSMYGFTIIIGMIFASVIQAIRFSIHSRNLGILLTIVLLVMQMASAGGLFPVDTQSEFYKVLNIILPMSKGVNILRETAFQTDWGYIFTQLGYLMIFLLLVPLGVAVNHYRTVQIYLDNNFLLPEKTRAWIEYRRYRKNKVKSRVATKKEKIKTRSTDRKGGA